MDQIMVVMRWAHYLSVNDRYSRGGRPRLRPQCTAWMEELAWRAKEQMAFAAFSWPEDGQLVVDVEMRFPDDQRVRDADNYLKSVLDGLEMGLGISDSRMIPFIRQAQVVPPEQAGFTVRLYDNRFGGHGLTGRFGLTESGKSVIILDKTVPVDWLNERVVVNVGMVVEE